MAVNAKNVGSDDRFLSQSRKMNRRSQRQRWLRVNCSAVCASLCRKRLTLFSAPGEAKASFIDDRRRKSVNETDARNLCGVSVEVGKIDRNDRRRVVAALALGIETRNLVFVAWSPVDLEIFLVVGNVARLWAHKVCLNQSVPSVRNRDRRPVG